MTKPNNTRTKVPKKIETEVLLKSGRRCCICWGLHRNKDTREGQIAHLDHNPSNNAPENLVWLCLEHHAQYDTVTSQSKGLTVEEVKWYREALYRDIQHHAESEHIDKEPDCPPIVTASSPPVQTIIGNNNVAAGRDININRRVVRRVVVQPGPTHVSEEQALRIRTSILELFELEKKSYRHSTPAKWYTKLYKQFGVTSYKLIPASRFADVISWLQQQGARQRPHLRRSNNDEWRKSLYKAIWARASEIRMTKEAVYSLACEALDLRSPIDSLTALGERQLNALHDAVFRLPRD